MLRADRESELEPERCNSRGHVVAQVAREAIDETERRLCGSGAVSRAAVAEGLALAGRRAATLLGPDNAGPVDSAIASTRVAWVHHRMGSVSASGFAFELTSSMTQDAVDHCLVAHDLARRLGAPGLCTFTQPQSGRLDLIRLPDEAMIDELCSETKVELRPAVGDEQAMLSEAMQAFQQVSIITGRSLAAVTSSGMASAEYALVTSGATKSVAQQLAQALEAEGVRCRVICVHLVHPFPAADLSRAVSGLKEVLLIPDNESILDMTRRAVVAGGQTAPAVLFEPRCAATALDAARLAFGLPATHGEKAEVASVVSPITLTVRPAGVWAKRFLLDAAARLGTFGEFTFNDEKSVLMVSCEGREPTTTLPIELALCAHPSYLETGGLLSEMSHGGTLVVVSTSPVGDSWWDELRAETRASILELELRLRWIDLNGAPGLDLADPEAVQAVMLDGFLAAGAPRLTQVIGRESEDICEPGPMLPLDPGALEERRLGQGPDFRPVPDRLPSMSEEPVEPNDEVWRDAVRRFHFTGNGAHSAAEPTLTEPLHPLVLETIDTPARLGSRYPLLVRSGKTGDTSLAVTFETCATAILEKLAADGETATILTQHLPRLSEAVGRALSRSTEVSDSWSLVTRALDDFQRGFDLSDAASEALRSELESFRQQLDTLKHGSVLVGLDETTLLRLYTATVRKARRQRRAVLLEEIDSLRQRLMEMLAIDDNHAPETLSAEALKSRLDTGVGTFFDPQKLAANLPPHRGPVRLGSNRRQRIEQTLKTLHEAHDDNSDIDLVLLQHGSGSAPEGLPGVRVLVHPRGLEAAIGLFDGMADQSADLFRALRVARLEIDGAYDPDLHDAPLAEFGWQGLTEDELLSLPRMVVLETDERLRGAGLGAFSELLRSGRPVHVLVAQSTSELRSAETWQGLAGFHPGLGYLAVAHREAFVVESSLVCPERLVRDLERMSNSLRPATALVAVPVWNAPVPHWVQLLAAEQGRAIPCFTYDPGAGSTWAERFDLEGNPQPTLPWPSHTVRYLDAKGVETTLEQAFTFAHAVALDPAYRRHFRIVPGEAWSVDQMELADYLAAPTAAVGRKIPFIWVVGEGGRLARALITRELTWASRDRVRAWRILQELAGTDNEYARRATEAARLESQVEAEETREIMEREHVAEVERVRTEAAGEAMDRLSRVLMDLDAVPSARSASPGANTAQVTQTPRETAGDSVPAEQATESATEEDDDDTDASFNEAYIDSVLCTSCQECILINPRLFKYDANKQAFITEPGNGTYEELVKAAEKCPARCIHPGLPVAGDETANDVLIARAAKFN